MTDPDPIHHLFVYGTLRPGEVRWRFLEPFAADEGTADAVIGHLFDTGLGYPAAMFAGITHDASDVPVRGRTYRLHADRLAEALEKLDEVEGAVRGLYARVVVQTANGVTAWAYQFGADPDITLSRIAGGDWQQRA